MKKILAVLLSLICIFSSATVTASAGVFDVVFTNITLGMGMEPDEPIIYGITYASDKIFSGVSVMYMPSTTFKFTNPGTYTVTDDIPLSVDYNFVCWEDEDTGKLYYAGDKIYIDGQKTFYAVWEPKTDNNVRPIRVIITAVEALRRTLQAFFGFYKVKYVEDPVDKIEDKDLFDIENLVSYEYYYGIDKRHFRIAIEPCAAGVVYEAFDKNDKIFFGGDFEYVEVWDKDGNKSIEEQFRGATEYSAHYQMTQDVYTAENGVKYQLIDVTLTDGVPDPVTGMYVTMVLPRGFLRYVDGNGKYQTNKTYAFSVKTTKLISPYEENRFPLDNLLKSSYDYETDKRTFTVAVENVIQNMPYDKIENTACQIYVDDVAYPALCNMSADVYEENGVKYQTLKIAFDSSVAEDVPQQGAKIKITIPDDILTFKYTDGIVKKNQAYTINF